MLAIRLMKLFSDSEEDFTKLTGILGLYFQIRDDYCNLCLQEVWLYLVQSCIAFASVELTMILIDVRSGYTFQYSENKSYCEDLTEGKFSFPVIHAIRSRPDDLQVIRILWN